MSTHFNDRTQNRKTQRAYNKFEQRLSAHGVDDKRRRVCGSKVCYTKAQARSAAARISLHTGEAYHHYRCPFCRAWHTGRHQHAG